MKLSNIKKQTSADADAKLKEQSKLLEAQQLEKNMEYQKQIDSLISDKVKLNDSYQR